MVDRRNAHAPAVSPRIPVVLSLGLQDCSSSLISLLLQHFTAGVLKRLQLVFVILFGTERRDTFDSFGALAAGGNCSCYRCLRVCRLFWLIQRTFSNVALALSFCEHDVLHICSGASCFVGLHTTYSDCRRGAFRNIALEASNLAVSHLHVLIES